MEYQRGQAWFEDSSCSSPSAPVGTGIESVFFFFKSDFLQNNLGNFYHTPYNLQSDQGIHKRLLRGVTCSAGGESPILYARGVTSTVGGVKTHLQCVRLEGLSRFC